MKKILSLMVVSLLVLPLAVFAQDGNQDIKFAPRVISAEGSNGGTFFETRWPDFYKYEPAGGCSGLSAYSLRRKINGVPDSLYPVSGNFFSYVKNDPNPFKHIPSDTDYVSFSTAVPNVNGKPPSNLAVTFPDQAYYSQWQDYRQSARILVTWTVRLEGKKNIIQVNRKHDPWFSSDCGGTSYQAFPEGEVYTKLFVNGKAYGEPAIMTIPDGGTGRASGVVDPTHTGIVALTPAMFGGSFPAQMNFEVRLYNDTSMGIDSPAGMRNLVVTMTPVN